MKVDSSIPKTTLWARHPTVVRLPRIANLPRIPSRKFSSHQEFNAWKQALCLDIIRNGGFQWERNPDTGHSA